MRLAFISLYVFFCFQGKAVDSTTSTRCGRCHLAFLFGKKIPPLYAFFSLNSYETDYH